MSHSATTDLGRELVPATAEGRKAFQDQVFQALSARFEGILDPADRWGLTVILPASRLREAVAFLRDEPQFHLDLLLDITAVDYLGYPGHDEARYAVVYNLRSQRGAGRRVRLKVRLEEESTVVPSLHDLYRIANWQERETFDQYGIVFEGHPDLRRLLNHIEFQGHPLRKDYPARKRQWLSTNDPLVDPMVARLKSNGFTVLETPTANAPSIEETTLLGKVSREQRNNVENPS